MPSTSRAGVGTPGVFSPKSQIPLALAGVPEGTGHTQLGVRRSCLLARLVPTRITRPVEFRAKRKCCRHPDRSQGEESQASSLQCASPFAHALPTTICWSQGSSGRRRKGSHRGGRPPGEGLRSPGGGWPRFTQRAPRSSGRGITCLHPKGCSLSLNMAQGSFSAKTQCSEVKQRRFEPVSIIIKLLNL